MSQNIHSKRDKAQRFCLGLFLLSDSILADWTELLCHSCRIYFFGVSSLSLFYLEVEERSGKVCGGLDRDFQWNQCPALDRKIHLWTLGASFPFGKWLINREK